MLILDRCFVFRFPDEAMSVVNKDQRPFTEIGIEKVRTEFKQNAAVDAPTATKLISSAGKELKAIYSMLENDNLNQFPGPPVSIPEKLFNAVEYAGCA